MGGVVWAMWQRSVIIPAHRTGRANLRHPALRLFHCKDARQGALLLGHSSSESLRIHAKPFDEDAHSRRFAAVGIEDRSGVGAGR